MVKEFSYLRCRPRENGKRGMHRTLHSVIAEKAFGRPLPPGSIVHHIDGNTKNNQNNNLLICPDQAYHLLIHARTRAYEASGNADFRKCTYCGSWDDPNQMTVSPLKGGGSNAYHKACAAKYGRAWRKKQKAA